MAIGVCCGLAAPAWGEPLSLRLGILPYAPDAALVQIFGPLQDRLEAELDVRVVLVSAPDYAAFVRRILAGDYDLAFTAPHIALLALEEAHWQPLVRTMISHRTVIVVARDSPLHALADLRGHTVAMPDPLALVTLRAEGALADGHLVPGKDVTIIYRSTHENAMLLVAHALADGGVSVTSRLAGLPAQMRARLRVLVTFPEPFEVVYMAAPGLAGKVRERVRTVLLHLQDTPRGRRFLEQHGTPRYVPLDASDLQRYGTALPNLKRRLQEASVH